MQTVESSDGKMTDILTIRAEDLAHETIEGETIVIDMREQTYFRLEGAAAAAWQVLAAGVSEERLLGHLKQSYPDQADDIAAALPGFLSDLRARDLIVDGTAEAAVLPAIEPRAYTGLVLHSFSDLEEILWVDPVHDVDDATGWPTLPAA